MDIEISLRQKSLLICFFVMAALTFVACDFTSRRTQSLIDSYKLEPKETLYVGFAQVPQSLDWNFSTDMTASAVEANIMEGLTTFEMHGQQTDVVPALAEKWDVQEGGTKYIFKLREGLQWTDGTPLKAQHFVDSIQRVQGLNSPWADSYSNVRSVKATDDKTVIFNLKESQSYFPAILAHHSAYPVRQDLISKFKDDWAKKENLVTLGTYKIADAKSDNFLVLRQYEKYTLKKPILKNVVLRFGLKPAEALKLVSSGQLNALADIPLTQLKDFEAKDELVYMPLLDIAYLTFDMKHKPMSNPIFRRIVGMSINREEVAHSLMGAVKPLGGFIPPGLLGYESNRGVRFDPDMAKQVMQHSGYRDLNKYGSFYLKVSLSAGEDAAAENIAKQIEKVLGVNIKILKANESVPEDAPTFFLSHWLASVPDAQTFLNLFTSGSKKNITGWKNRNYDEFVKQAGTATSPDSKEKLYAKAQHILTETEMPVIPLYLDTQFSLLQKKVSHFPLNVLGFMPFRGVSIE